MTTPPGNTADKGAGPIALDDAELITIRGGSGRRVELDHAGSYNFVVEIEGVAAGYVHRTGYIGETEKN